MTKRLVSMILSAVLFATSVPVAAFAEDEMCIRDRTTTTSGNCKGVNGKAGSTFV